jgi:hypothetical protein
MEREPGSGGGRWSVYRPSRSRVTEGERARTAGATKPADAPTPTPTPRPRTSRLGIAIAVGAVVLVFGIAGVAAYLGSDRDGSGPFGGGEVQVLTTDGVADLLAALDDETGSTEAFSATIYPTYAVVRVPVDDRSQREIGYYWDGRDLEEWGSKGTSSYERFDLADIDTDLLLPLVREAKAQVDDPTSWYVIIDHTRDEEGWISAYASNEYSEGGYVEVDLEGTEVRRVTWPDATAP